MLPLASKPDLGSATKGFTTQCPINTKAPSASNGRVATLVQGGLPHIQSVHYRIDIVPADFTSSRMPAQACASFVLNANFVLFVMCFRTRVVHVFEHMPLVNPSMAGLPSDQDHS